MTKQDIMTLVKSLPTEYTSRSTIELTNLNNGKTDSFTVPTISVKKKLLMMTGWTTEKLQQVSIKVS